MNTYRIYFLCVLLLCVPSLGFSSEKSSNANLISLSTPDIYDNLIFGRDIIRPDYSIVPFKGQTVIEHTTGTEITRMTDFRDATIDQPGLLIVYSRYSPLNSSGEYLLVHGEDSTSSWVYNASDYGVVDKLRSDLDENHTIGELNEIRWDYSGLHPTKVYFVVDMKLYAMDILNQDQTRSVVHDFSIDFPDGVQILNDVEGDSSSDSRYWAFMVRAHYDGSEFPILRIITYDSVTDRILGILNPSDVGRTNYLPRPNMVEISPRGTRVITHYGRCWDENRTEDIGSSLDAPHAWKLNFTDPIKVSVDETHSGWAFDEACNEIFVSQNNVTDQTEAININTGTSMNIISHEDLGWGNGFHYGKFYQPSRPGWIFISTYATENDEWANNQLLMVELKPESENPRVLRVTPSYNEYDGDYRNEGVAALNIDGTQIFWTSNWGNNLENMHREVFRARMPGDWFVPVSPTIRNVSNNAGTTTFSVSNTGTGVLSWTAVVTSGDSWLSITSGDSGSNSGTITCSYSANTTTSSRTATIRITTSGATGNLMNVTVIQEPAQTGCTATIDENLLLHIPYLSFADSTSGPFSLWVDLLYEFNPSYSALIVFKLTNYAILTDPSFSCTASTLSENLRIHIPDVLFPDETTRLWVNLEYSAAFSTNGNACFYVTNYGVVSN